ncbi:glutamate racemase [Enterobacteriaceae endosymbiont of Donacia bicoloricornis]|uniref:glutamate racemase n=1 Tax=Enterobacteriaceae endosymbiont of Donacia bicoloricornis TaxID=2675772 RepID=UPI0014493964|nr:glutamate racemase [Enterobacteriaceae endosymbiont of Donacia bicoloricornis]QJC37857.1 glutamate racemase [Enterobacteriaceae endosymbiont of Donacia bicoloricornis]
MKKKFLKSQNTIFIFDSGLGGITIFNYIKNIFLNINFIYLLDNKYFPYGNKSKNFILQRLIKILKKISNNYNITLAIIACNTASISSLPTIKNYFNFPIIGVTPAIDLATQKTKNNVIGFLATNTTLKNNKIKKKINFLSTKYKIKTISSSKLVFLAEKKLLGYKIIIDEIKKIFRSWYNFKIFPDTIILGCTHFPLILNELKIIFPKNIYFLDSKKDVILKYKENIDFNKIKIKKKENIVFYTKKNEYLKQIKLLFFKKGFKNITNLKI